MVYTFEMLDLFLDFLYGPDIVFLDFKDPSSDGYLVLVFDMESRRFFVMLRNGSGLSRWWMGDFCRSFIFRCYFYYTTLLSNKHIVHIHSETLLNMHVLYMLSDNQMLCQFWIISFWRANSACSLTALSWLYRAFSMICSLICRLSIMLS